MNPTVTAVQFTDAMFVVTLDGGREIASRLTPDTFPRLWHGTPEERACYETADDEIHWPNLNEDVRIPDLLAGIDNSGESKNSVNRWLASIREFRESEERELQTFTEWDLRRRGLWR